MIVKLTNIRRKLLTLIIKSTHYQLWQIIIKRDIKITSPEKDYNEEEYSQMQIDKKQGTHSSIHSPKMNIRKCANSVIVNYEGNRYV